MLARPVEPASELDRRSLFVETALVLGVSLGASASLSVLSLIRKLTAAAPLSAQTTSMNQAVTPDRPWLDLAYQTVGIALALVPVVLALHLLGRDLQARNVRGRDLRGSVAAMAHVGIDRSGLPRDLSRAAALTALIGIPGVGLYLAARSLGLNTTVSTANLPDVWWAVPILVLAAAQNAVLEEVIMVGYLFTRWGQAQLPIVTIIVGSALIRGTYHLYQGFGGFVGNVVMGLIFGVIYANTRRVTPLIVAHLVLDIFAFVGYLVLAPRVGWL